MRAVSPQWATTVAQLHAVVCTVTGYYNGAVTREIPIVSGSITYDLTAAGKRRCAFLVPLVGPDGFNWYPGTDPLHPLATYGQRVHVALGVVHPDGTTETVSQGFYLIYTINVDQADGVVQVSALDLQQLWTDQRIINEGATFPPTLTAKLLANRLSYVNVAGTGQQITPVVYDADVADFTPATRPEMPDGGDRMQALGKLLDAWPAAAMTDDLGRMRIYTPATAAAATPDVTIAGDTATGTLVGRGREQSRQRMYNAVKLISRNPSSGVVTATFTAQRTFGPLSVNGPMGRITRWGETDLMPPGFPAGQFAANRMLAEGVLYTRTETVTAVPNPAIELEDTCQVITSAGGTFTGLVTSIRLPMTAADGPMQISVTNEQE